MKLRILIFILSLVLAGPVLAGQTYTIDPSHSYALFAVGHMGLSVMHGRIDVTGGELVLDREGDDSRVDVTLDPASVDTGNRKRDAHLLYQDGFFEVDKYPKMRFVSDNVQIQDKQALVKGKLTMHGVTRPVKLAVTDITCKTNPMEKSRYTCGFTAHTTIARSDFGMDAFSKLVADRVGIAIEAEANRPVAGAE